MDLEWERDYKIQYSGYLDDAINYWKNDLIALNGSVRSVQTGGMESHTHVMENIGQLYAEFFNVTKSAFCLMYTDWNILRECLRDAYAFDNYMKSVFEHQYSRGYGDICDSIWKKGNVEDTSGLSDLSMSVDGIYRYYEPDHFVVTGTDVESLDQYIEALNSFVGSGIPKYRTSINEFRSFYSFKGKLADASRAYIFEVHTSFLDAAESLSREFIRLIKSYQDEYGNFGHGNDFRIDIEELRETVFALHTLKQFSLPIFNTYNTRINVASQKISPLSPINIKGGETLDSAAQEIDKIITRVKTIENNFESDISRIKNCITHLEKVVARLKTSSGYRILSYHSNDHVKLFTINGKNPFNDLDSNLPQYILSKILTDRGYLDMSSKDISELLKSYGIIVDVEHNPFVYNGMARFYREYTKRGGSGIIAAERVLEVARLDPNLLSQYYFNTDFRMNINEGDAKYLIELGKRGISFPDCKVSEEDFLYDIANHPMVVIPNAVIRADQIAWDDRHGYINNDPLRRFGPYDYDCASVVAEAYIEQGIPLRSKEYQAEDGHTVFSTKQTTTGTNLAVNEMYQALEDNGFDRMTCPSSPSDLEPGDVLINSHHVEIYIGHEQTVSASMISGNGGWYDPSKGDQRIFSVDENGVKHETLESVFNGEISRDSLIGDWENVLKESDGIDYLEDSHDSYSSSWSTAYRYSGRTGLARIDYNEISSKIDSYVNFNEEYNQRFRDFEAKLHAENE